MSSHLIVYLAVELLGLGSCSRRLILVLGEELVAYELEGGVGRFRGVESSQSKL